MANSACHARRCCSAHARLPHRQPLSTAASKRPPCLPCLHCLRPTGRQHPPTPNPTNKTTKVLRVVGLGLCAASAAGAAVYAYRAGSTPGAVGALGLFLVTFGTFLYTLNWSLGELVTRPAKALGDALVKLACNADDKECLSRVGWRVPAFAASVCCLVAVLLVGWWWFRG